MYPILQSSVPTTSGFVPHRPTSTFKPISPATPLPVAGLSQQGSFNSLLDQVNSTQNGSPASGSSIPCAQRSPANKQNSLASTQQGTPTHSQSSQSQQVPNQQNATSQQQFASPQANTQNVAPPQPSVPAPQLFQQSPVAHQQQQPLLQPSVPGRHAAHQQHSQPQFVQPRVSPQGKPIRQPFTQPGERRENQKRLEEGTGSITVLPLGTTGKILNNHRTLSQYSPMQPANQTSHNKTTQ